jgi:hypothetical protein
VVFLYKDDHGTVTSRTGELVAGVQSEARVEDCTDDERRDRRQTAGGKKRVVEARGTSPDEHGPSLGPELVRPLTRGLAGNPPALAAGGGNSAVEGA